MSEKRRGTNFTHDGVLVIDKPSGWTSHDVVARVRRILGTRRVGHTGTLDPFATGVLVVCVNHATRLVQFLTGDDKEYAATVRFGYATDTGDLTGAPLAPATSTDHISVERVRAALAALRGRVMQVPPMYSAKKVGGVKLYEMARRGETVERRPVEVELSRLELCTWPADSPATVGGNDAVSLRANVDGTRDCDVCVQCSSGTYVRVLAEDIGRRLGVGAHLTRLRRTRAGRCSLRQAVTLAALEERAAAGRAADVLIPMTDALELPAVELSEAERRMIAHGRVLCARRAYADGAHVKLIESGLLQAVAVYDARTHSLRPCVVLSADSTS